MRAIALLLLASLAGCMTVPSGGGRPPECRSGADCRAGFTCTQGACEPLPLETKGLPDLPKQWEVTASCPLVALAIQFPAGADTLDEAARGALQEVAIAFRCQPRQVTVAGHGDPGTAAPAALRVGDRRARAAARHLEALGVPALAIRTVSYGNEKPACTEATPACQAERRRVEILVSGPIEATAEAPPQDVDRFPTVEAPAAVVEGQVFPVDVSLTMDLKTPTVVVKPGGAAPVQPTGALDLGAVLPPAGPSRSWSIDVTILSPGFEVVGPSLQTIRLPEAGDSSTAKFLLKARGAAQPERKAPLFATYWHQGQLLAKVALEIQIRSLPRYDGKAPAAPTEAPARSVTRASTAAAPGEDGDLGPPADMTLQLLDGTDPGHPELGVASVFGPRLKPAQAVVTAPPDLESWLAGRYGALAVAGRGLKRAAGASPKDQAAALLRSVGRELYARTPRVVQAGLRRLAAQAVRGAKQGSPPPSLLILTTDPRFPWELVLVPGPGGEELRVGDAFSVARWHVTTDDTVSDRPEATLLVDRLLAMAPSYEGTMALRGQAAELEALGQLAGDGLKRVPGTRPGLEAAVGDGANGAILHYAGHGVVQRGPGTAPAFDLQLEDGAMGAVEWAGLLGPERAPTLVFLNACEVGQAEAVAGRAYGWGPAALEGGAAAFVGPLWPIDDQVAVAAAKVFYGAVRAGKPVAEALRLVRAEYAARGDPSYLAYVFYGDPALRLEWSAGP